MESLEFHLTVGQMALLLILYGGFAWFGHPEYLLGIYFSYISWMRSVLFGPIANTWVLMGAMIVASSIYILNSGRFRFLPSQGKWFAYWMGLWWIWMFVLLLCLNNHELRWILLRMFLCFTVAPVLILLIFSHDLERVKGFIVAYIISTMCGGLLSLYINKISLTYLLQDPLLSHKGLGFLGTYNYHWFGQIFATSIILTSALYLKAHRFITQFILLTIIAILAYFLYVSGSRHSALGFILSFSIFIAWALRRMRNSFFSLIIIFGLIIFLAAGFYQASPKNLTRSDNSGVEDALVSSSSKRIQLWEDGLQNFANSPIWGTGFEEYVTTHNFFIGVLADQGLVGFIMLMGLLVFLGQLTHSVWHDPRSSLFTIFRMAFWCIAIFCLFYSQFNGNIMSSMELYWSIVLMWSLGSSDVEEKFALSKDVHEPSKISA